MRISDWSSDVCSSDLPERQAATTTTGASSIRGAASMTGSSIDVLLFPLVQIQFPGHGNRSREREHGGLCPRQGHRAQRTLGGRDRRSVVEGKRVSYDWSSVGAVTLKKQ